MIKLLWKRKHIVLVLILSLLSVKALFHSGLPPTHDGEYHVVRFFEFNKVLSEGVIYPRWAPDLNKGMGAPLFNYVYPLPNYFSSFTHTLGFSFIDSFKLNLIFATIIGAIFMFLFAKIFFGNTGGLASSVYYTYAPYRFLDVFIRGSVGEVWALAFFPAFLWAITKLSSGAGKIYVPISAVFLALIIFSHNILALMFFGFSLIYVGMLVLYKKDKNFGLRVTISFILGLLLSSVFWIPALFEKKYVRGLDVFDFRDNFPELYQLLIPSWGSGFSGGGIAGQMSFQVGIANLFVVLLSLILIVRFKKRIRREIVFFAASFFIVFFLIMKSSTFLWENMPFLSYFQFPWRFLSLTIFIASFLAGFVVLETTSSKKISSKLKPFLLGSIIALPIVTTVSYAKPAFYHERNDTYYTSRSNFISGTNSPGDAFNTVWARDINGQNNEFEYVGGEGKISIGQESLTKYSLYIEGEGVIRSPVMYFPGWALRINGEKRVIHPGKNGKIEFVAPRGVYTASLELENTRIQLLALLLSTISGAVLVLFLIRNYTIIRK